jgi:hypothetical protein
VPFDEAYEPLFEALVFTIAACGYRARCALEESESGDIRLDKLVELIRESPRSIHDLSRIEVGDNDLPRFNMPFELGLALGAKRFGRPPRDRIKIMVAEPYRLPAYLSDLGGNVPMLTAMNRKELFASCAITCNGRPAAWCSPDQRSLLRTLPPSNGGCLQLRPRSTSPPMKSADIVTTRRSLGASPNV